MISPASKRLNWSIAARALRTAASTLADLGTAIPNRLPQKQQLNN